jgi:hypothetical protein
MVFKETKVQPMSKCVILSACLLVPSVLIAGDAPDPARGAKIAEYSSQIAKLSPRDAEGFYNLGKWCQTQGLGEQATKAFERAIRIDPDHPEARAALGFKPSGTGWSKEGSAPRRTVENPEPSETVPSPSAVPSEPAEKGSKKAPASTPAKVEPKATVDEGEPKSEYVKPEDLVAAKKKWAQEAAEKLGNDKFSVYEDEDFLIHTTYDAKDPKVRALATTLKNLKSKVVTFTGRPKGPMWPGKLHFIFMKALTQCMRFSEAIDGHRFPEEEGFYTDGDAKEGFHTVFSAIPEKNLAFLLGWTSLDRFGNSDRYVGWWLREGLGKLLEGSTDDGKKERLIEQAFKRTGSEIDANPDSVSAFKLLETEGYKPNAIELNQAEALTLVLYLISQGGSKLQKVIEELKSADAPRPDLTDKLFFSRYTAFQEKSISNNYRDKLEKINDKWKAYVKAKVAEIDRNTKEETKTAPQPKKKTTTNKKGG